MIKPKLEIRKWEELERIPHYIRDATKEEIYKQLCEMEDAYITSLNPIAAKCLFKCSFECTWNGNDYDSWHVRGYFQEPENLAQERLDKEMVKYNEYLDGEEERNKQKALNLQARKEDRLKELNKEIVKMQEEILSKQELIKTLQTAWGLGDD